MQKKSHPSLLTRQIILGTCLVFAAILFFVLLNNFTAVSKVFERIWGLFSPFVAAFIIAYLLNRPVLFFERRVFTRFRMRRGLSIATVYLLAILLLGSLISVVVPQVVNSLSLLIKNITPYINDLGAHLPKYIEDFHLKPEIAEELFNAWESILTYITGLLEKLLPKLLDYSFAAGRGLLNFFMALIASIYMLMSKKTLLRSCRRLIGAVFSAKKAQRLLDIGRHSNRVFSDFIVGKILDSVIIGLLCFFGMVIIYQPYAVLISLIIGITNIIPFFGPFIGAIPSIFILLIADPWAALFFFIFIIVLQQFDGNILGPRILGNSTGLSPLWVLISITVAGGLFGFIGMLFGVPTCAVLYSLGSAFVERRLKQKQLDDDCRNFITQQPVPAAAEAAADVPQELSCENEESKS